MAQALRRPCWFRAWAIPPRRGATLPSGLLEAWDQYAASLSDGGSQKNAWTQLLGMDDQVRALRGSLGGLGESNPALENIVNELEIMAATEKFKLNRGDYA